jgi:hypothetical protein
MPGIVDNTAKCTSAGQGLSWNGSTFGCTDAYSWNLKANSENTGATIGAGNIVNFLAGNGLSVSRSGGNNVTYNVDAPTCTSTQKLMWKSSGFYCAIDNDTIAQVGEAQRCHINWSTSSTYLIDTLSVNNSFQVGQFTYYDFQVNTLLGYETPLPDDTLIGYFYKDTTGINNAGCIPRSSIQMARCAGQGDGTGVDFVGHAGTLSVCNNGRIVASHVVQGTDLRFEQFFMNKLTY